MRHFLWNPDFWSDFHLVPRLGEKFEICKNNFLGVHIFGYSAFKLKKKHRIFLFKNINIKKKFKAN